MAQSAYKSNEFKQAEKLYSKSKTSKKSSLEKAKTYHNIGNAHLKQKNYKQAVEAYKKSLRNNPSDEQTRYNLAEALKKKKKEEEKKDKKKNEEKKKPQHNPTNSKPNEKSKEINKPQDKKNEENKPTEEKSKENHQSILNDKKTDRMLDDLVKKEMETKKKLGGQKSKGNPPRRAKTCKDW